MRELAWCVGKKTPHIECSDQNFTRREFSRLHIPILTSEDFNFPSKAVFARELGSTRTLMLLVFLAFHLKNDQLVTAFET